jgi:UDP:flavonoid glycosyltransferase YjiC (YdhE family)
VRIALITFGSEGDVRPVAALAAGLAAAGHRPVLVADRVATPLVEGRGVELRPLSGDVRALTATGAAAELFERGADPRALTRSMVRLGRAHVLDWARESLEAARGADAIFGAGLGAYTALSLAERLGVPAVLGALQPIGPTGDFPPPLVPPPRLRLPRPLNRALHLALMNLVWLGFRGPTNRARREVLGLPPWPLLGPSALIRRRGVATLYGVSPSLVPPPRDWPSTSRVTGAWFLEEAGEGAGERGEARDGAPRLPPDLAAFLGAGPPPVYVGFGSMGGFDPAAATRLVLDALGGRRAVLATGWGALGPVPRPAPPHVFEIGAAPHVALFPRVSVAVHHGGAGTTHAAARAGVPSVVVPFLGDQPFWGRRLRDLGVAPEPIPRRHLSAEALAGALAAAEDPAMRARASALGDRVRAERGVEAAVRLIEGAVGARARMGEAGAQGAGAASAGT